MFALLCGIICGILIFICLSLYIESKLKVHTQKSLSLSDQNTKSESVEWFNQIAAKVFEYLRTFEGQEQLNQKVVEIIQDTVKEISFFKGKNITSDIRIGCEPNISNVNLVSTKGDDFTIVISLKWHEGISALISIGNKSICVDLRDLLCSVELSMKGDLLNIQFLSPITTDADISIFITKILAFSLTSFPIVGKAIKVLAAFILMNIPISINIGEKVREAIQQIK